MTPPSLPSAVEEYLGKLPEEHVKALQKLRIVIRSMIPDDALEKISYNIPAFYCEGPLVSYAAFRKHYSFFPMSSTILDQFAEETQQYRTSKGTLQFSFEEKLPVSLIKKIVKVRLKENKARLQFPRKTSPKK